jgi:hypothetical protein
MHGILIFYISIIHLNFIFKIRSICMLSGGETPSPRQEEKDLPKPPLMTPRFKPRTAKYSARCKVLSHA